MSLDRMITLLASRLGHQATVPDLMAEVGGITHPTELRKALSSLRGPARPFSTDLLMVMPRAGEEVFGDWHLWFHWTDGAWGRDWLATPAAAPQELVELEQLPPRRWETPEDQRREPQEIQALLALRHPGLAGLIATGSQGDIPFRVVEFVDGTPLRTALDQRGILSTSPCLRLAIQTGRALEALHGAGLVHGSLSPACLIIDPQAQVRIVDVGRARGLPPEGTIRVSALTPDDRLWETGTGQKGGTRQWRRVDRTRLDTTRFPQPPTAPEGEVTPAADLHGLGQILLLAATGPDPAALATLDQGLARLIRGCLERSPANRPTAGAAADLAEALLEGRKGTARLTR